MTEQFELLGEPTKLTVIPHNCGRGLGPCAVFEETPGQLRCATCGCVGPMKRNVTQNALDGFFQAVIRSQSKK